MLLLSAPQLFWGVLTCYSACSSPLLVFGITVDILAKPIAAVGIPRWGLMLNSCKIIIRCPVLLGHYADCTIRLHQLRRGNWCAVDVELSLMWR